MEITLEILLKEVEDALRRGYSIGYASGYVKGKDPYSIETDSFKHIIEHHLEHLKDIYENKS